MKPQLWKSQIDLGVPRIGEYLDWLGVDFDVSKEHDMFTLLQAKNVKRAWTHEHDKSIDDFLAGADFPVIKDCVTQLSAYEVKALTEAVDKIKVKEHAPDFTETFRCLRHVVSLDPSQTAAVKRQMKKTAKACKARRFVAVNISETSRHRVPSQSSEDTDFATSSKDETYSENSRLGFLETSRKHSGAHSIWGYGKICTCDSNTCFAFNHLI